MNSAILISSQTKSNDLIKSLKQGVWREFEWLQNEEVGIFSTQEIERFIEEEEIHDRTTLTENSAQSLKSMSSGERKNALLNYLLQRTFQTLILVNPYDNLDTEKVGLLKTKLEEIGNRIQLVQLLTRASDALEITQSYFCFRNSTIEKFADRQTFLRTQANHTEIANQIPEPIEVLELPIKTLISFKKVSVSFNGKQVLQNICWDIRPGEFWQLRGPNGSGKSTLLNMITGESHKGYGQDLTLFGLKKGHGESIWDIKELLGYFTPAMIDRFRGYHTIENMLISGLHDSVGLYQKPSHKEQELALQWLTILNMSSRKNDYFHQLSQGEKRLVMTARAMIKHPPLLILDEPTVGLDDNRINFFVALVNKFAHDSRSAVVYVSHRTEKGLRPQKCFDLLPTKEGSKGLINIT
ncbi:ABC transporter ATP-binding protein [Croceivirga thetidis]|uniref:ATP-binding cassette domain-containing protein n=1 Tax=Croceivirga thetidis TaxID=2721623 RepID=A0ABX1GT10_9FLAO|nr:ATP-binding cassette domain-containing protein [Croceivirga thetidis]NKI33097.1 ATP-binding cassette domain-containing protein [Croceivirga thetidis]